MELEQFEQLTEEAQRAVTHKALERREADVKVNLYARIDRLQRTLEEAVDAHIKITSAMRAGGRTPEKALDTMMRIRRELGK